MKPFLLAWTITSMHEGVLIREFLKEKEISKAALTDIKFNGGSIKVNGELATVRYPLKEHDTLEVTFPPEEPSKDLVAENLPLNIVFEDEALLVINKPAGMSTIPSREHPTGSLANALLYYYKQNEIHSTVHIVNRLDRDTSGVLLVAKHRHIHHLFSKQQKVHHIKRRYEAIVHGQIPIEHGTISAPIGRADHSIIEREVRSDGQEAVTHYKVLSCFSNYTYVSLTLETGRTHQIRVHMAHIGHPLLGDNLYGGTRRAIHRQALHSCDITFFHPVKEEWMNFSVELADDMKKLITGTEGQAP